MKILLGENGIVMGQIFINFPEPSHFIKMPDKVHAGVLGNARDIL